MRDGDDSAYGELYRRHLPAAESTARCLLRSRGDADDIVADAFAGVLQAIRNGRGPRDNFRRYLLACVRNGCRSWGRTVPVEPGDIRFEPRDRDVDAVVLEDPEQYVEASVVAKAFAVLTPRWQAMLWSTAVEQKTAQEVGRQMNLSPNAASALAHRAREAFATAYLAEHVASHLHSGDCERVVPQLAAYVRGQLAPGRVAMVDQHLADCPSCAAAAADLRDVNTTLRSLVPPAALATIINRAAAPTTATTAGSAMPLGGMFLKGIVGLLLVAPVLLADSNGFEGGTARELRAPDRPVDAAPPGLEADAAPPPPIEALAAAPPPLVADRGDIELEAVGAGVGAGIDGSPAIVTDNDMAADAGSLGSVGAPGPAEVGSGHAAAPVEPETGGEPDPGEAIAGGDAPGLLASLGVDDLVGLVGVPALNDTVAAADALIHETTRDVVAPVVGHVTDALPADVTPLLPDVPGVVLVPADEPPAAGQPDPESAALDTESTQAGPAENEPSPGEPPAAVAVPAPRTPSGQPAVEVPLPTPGSSVAPTPAPGSSAAPADPPSGAPGLSLCLPPIDLGIIPEVTVPILRCDP